MKLTTGQLTWCLFGLASLVLWGASTAAYFYDNDFHSFYHAAEALRGIAVWASGAHDHPNLNPPTFTLLLVPLTFLPSGVAFALWTLGGLAALVDALRRIQARHHLPASAWPWIVGGLGATTPALMAWTEGQVTWWLLWLVTRAWLAPSARWAGLWLGLAIALKPPLALMALLLPWPIWATAAGVSATLSVSTVLLVGLGPWIDWLALGQTVHWMAWPGNLSVWGTTLRLWTGRPEGDPLLGTVPLWLLVALALGLVALAVCIVRTSGDRRWGHAVWWSVLASPLGWTYYVPLALGPMLGAWPTSRLGLVGLGLLTVPMPLLSVLGQPFGDLGTRTFGSAYTLGAWLLWIAWSRSPQRGVDYPARRTR